MRNAVVIGLLLVLAVVVVRSVSDGPNAVENDRSDWVRVSITSDPSGSVIYTDGRRRGKTPITLSVPPGEDVPYRVVPDEPYDDYDLYRPYSGTLNATEDTAVSVWVDRTTTEEQAAQRQAAEEARRRAEEEARRRRLASIALIVENWRWYRQYDNIIVEGMVTNNRSSSLEYARVAVRFYDGAGTFLGSAWSYLEYTNLLPGQSTTFTIYADYNPAYERAGLAFELDGRQLSSIRRSEID